MSKVTIVSEFALKEKRACWLFCFVILFGCKSTIEETISFTVDDSYLIDTPLSVDVSSLMWAAYEIRNNEKLVYFNYDEINGKLWFVHHPKNGKTYSIRKLQKKNRSNASITTKEENGDLKLNRDGQSLLSYRYEMTYPTKGIDSVFAKSGYIHPIVSPKGDTLTRIQPPDHWHHYGLWGPWTHTRIDTTRVDFWNLGEGMGTVLFKEFIDSSSGDVFSSFTARQEHIDFKTQEKPQIALNEDLKVRLWNLGRADRYMLDYTSSFSSPLENGILFEAYRYGGGLGLRFTERWKADNCSVLTSEGNDRLTADGTNARWAIVSGASTEGKGTSGILFMSNPKNRMHPEPMRVWPIDSNEGRGDMFFEFCPIRHEEWKIEPKTDYELKYRMVVFDGKITAEEAEAYWQAFAHPPKASLSKLKVINVL
jgi:hypothetical protein